MARLRKGPERYVGQNYELQVEIPTENITVSDIEKMKQDFFVAHEKNYGYYNPNAPVQFVNFRCEATGIVKKPNLAELETTLDDPSKAEIGRRLPGLRQGEIRQGRARKRPLHHRADGLDDGSPAQHVVQHRQVRKPDHKSL